MKPQKEKKETRIPKTRNAKSKSPEPLRRVQQEEIEEHEDLIQETLEKESESTTVKASEIDEQEVKIIDKIAVESEFSDMLHQMLQRQIEFEEKVVQRMNEMFNRIEMEKDEEEINEYAWRNSNYVEEDEINEEEDQRLYKTPKKLSPNKTKMKSSKKKSKRRSYSNDSSPSSSSSSSTESEDSEDSVNAELYMPRSSRKSHRGRNREDNLFRRISDGGSQDRSKIIKLQSEKFQEIIWKERSVNGYLRFLEDIEKFQLRNNQQVKYLVPLIEDKLREIVMSEVSMNYGEIFPTRKSIYEMEVSYLTATVQLMIKPSSKSHFLALPGGVRYVVECRYVRWEGKGRRRIVLGCRLFRKEFAWGAFDVYAYGTCFQLTDGMVLVDLDFCKLYPAILE
jgi:hypothetical protein